MNRWIRFGLLLWLTIALVIIAVAVIRLFDGTTTGAVSWGAPVGMIDGEPAFVMQTREESRILRVRGRAWSRSECWVVPEKQMDGMPSDVTQYWRVVAIEKPFHVTLEKQDESRTGPHELQFHDDVLEWAPDGKSFAFARGMSSATGVLGIPGERVWNLAVVREYLAEHVIAILIVGIVIAVVTVILRVRREARMRKYPNLCTSCGYDLRGSTAPGCPECGAGRTPAKI